MVHPKPSFDCGPAECACRAPVRCFGLHARAAPSPKQHMATLGGISIAEVEAKLSSALTASLCAPADERAAFIARYLVAGQAGIPPPKRLAEKPPNLEDEVAELNEMLRDAVNCAARHADQPLQRIADYLLRQEFEGNGLELEGDKEAALVAIAAATPAAVTPAASAFTATLNPVQKALNARRKPDMPVLGKTESTAGQHFVGMLQEENAKRIARTVDDDVIREAMAAGQKAMAAGSGSEKTVDHGSSR